MSDKDTSPGQLAKKPLPGWERFLWNIPSQSSNPARPAHQKTSPSLGEVFAEPAETTETTWLWGLDTKKKKPKSQAPAKPRRAQPTWVPTPQAAPPQCTPTPTPKPNPHYTISTSNSQCLRTGPPAAAPLYRTRTWPRDRGRPTETTNTAQSPNPANLLSLDTTRRAPPLPPLSSLLLSTPLNTPAMNPQNPSILSVSPSPSTTPESSPLDSGYSESTYEPRFSKRSLQMESTRQSLPPRFLPE